MCTKVQTYYFICIAMHLDVIEAYFYVLYLYISNFIFILSYFRFHVILIVSFHKQNTNFTKNGVVLAIFYFRVFNYNFLDHISSRNSLKAW